ncbi:restriction endonuclease subunit S [uncultured Polaribacter sp.]|uniref:restriction endonuclease subunit S n=1 Tax=uncultured Polaribacter sp. TaxID=174711 RepID=UPI002608CB85|nr:restriction endonuclease subunit S [uncultured Polaribacter sp.]
MLEKQINNPDGWILDELGKLILERKKSSLKVSDATNFGNYPFFTSGDAVLRHINNLIDGANIYLATGGLANIKYFEGKAAYSTDTFAIRTIDKVNTKYLYYNLLHIIYYINANYFQGSGLKHLQKNDLRKHQLLFPESNIEQQKIADILSKIDIAINNTEQLISKYSRIKKGLLQDLLVNGIDKKGNIRNEKTHSFKDSPLGKIPVDWDWSYIGESCYVTKLAGYEFTKYMKYREDGEVIALRALNIKNEKLLLDDVRRISQKVSDFLVRSQLHKGDVLITYIGAYIGDVVKINESNKYHLAPNIAKIVSGKKLSSDFLENILRSEKVQSYFKSLITTTANPSLTMGQIRKSYIIFPKDKDEQTLITSKIKKMKDFIDVLSSDLHKYQSLKAGLMQDLLSSKVRVNHLLESKEKENV